MYISTYRWSNKEIETQFARDDGITSVVVLLNTGDVIRWWHAIRKWLLWDVCDKSCSNTRYVTILPLNHMLHCHVRRRWETSFRSLYIGRTSYLLGPSGAQPLDSYRVSTRDTKQTKSEPNPQSGTVWDGPPPERDLVFSLWILKLNPKTSPHQDFPQQYVSPGIDPMNSRHLWINCVDLTEDSCPGRISDLTTC